jgi:DNA-binding transcriptional ArsR family regulator
MGMLRYFITSKAKRNLLKFFFLAGDEGFYTRQIARLTGEPLNAVRRELTYLEKAGLLHSHMEGNQKYYAIVKSFPLLAEWKKIILESEPAEVPARGLPGLLSAAPSTITAGTVAGGEVEERPDDNEAIVPGVEVVMHKRTEPDGEEKTVIKSAAYPEKSPQTATVQTIASFVEYLKDQFDDISSIALAVIHGDSARSEEIPDSGVDLLIVGDVNQDALLELTANIEDSTGVHLNLTRMTRSDFDYRNARGDPLIRRIWGEKKLVVKGRQTER